MFCRRPCKSLVKGEKILLTRALGGARTAEPARTRSSHACLSAMVPAFAEPDIHSLSRILADRHRRLSVCSLPVLKQSGESLGSLISVAQSATAGPGSLRAVRSCCFSPGGPRFLGGCALVICDGC